MNKIILSRLGHGLDHGQFRTYRAEFRIESLHVVKNILKIIFIGNELYKYKYRLCGTAIREIRMLSFFIT